MQTHHVGVYDANLFASIDPDDRKLFFERSRLDTFDQDDSDTEYVDVHGLQVSGVVGSP